MEKNLNVTVTFMSMFSVNILILNLTMKILREFYHYFNENACRWVTAEQEPCNSASNSTNELIETTNNISETSSATNTRTTTNSVLSTTSATTLSSITDETPIEMHQETAEIELPHSDGQNGDQSQFYSANSPFCEQPGSDWICLNGTQSLSLCVKRCQNGDISQKVCICENRSCSWFHKGHKCSLNSMSNPDVAPAMITPAMVPDPMENLSITGNLPFDNISSSESANDLVTLIHEINVSNTGYINVNLHLK